jgi:hypothetical protein
MKPLKILVNHFHQLRGYSVLTVVHFFLLFSTDQFVWLLRLPFEVPSTVLTADVIRHPSGVRVVNGGAVSAQSSVVRCLTVPKSV